MTYRVLILEDDPMVAAIDRQYVESDRHFQVVQVCKSGGQALEYLAHQDVELIHKLMVKKAQGVQHIPGARQLIGQPHHLRLIMQHTQHAVQPLVSPNRHFAG